jgi:hypothetical protein
MEEAILRLHGWGWKSGLNAETYSNEVGNIHDTRCAFHGISGAGRGLYNERSVLEGAIVVRHDG